MFIFGSIFNRSGSEPQGIPIAVLNQSNADVAKRIVATLDTMKSFEVVDSMVDDQGKVVVFDTNSIKTYVQQGKATARSRLPDRCI